MVLQDTWLFEGTVRDNIAYGVPDATQEEIVAAGESGARAQLHQASAERLRHSADGKTATTFPRGKSSFCPLRGSCCKKPPMLILDEATSSIDTRTELRIQKAFAQLMEGRTSFIVAHRLSTIRNADVILVMRDGQIVETGRHEELLEKRGAYYTLYNSQFAVR